jgi:hypothetical protein
MRLTLFILIVVLSTKFSFSQILLQQSDCSIVLKNAEEKYGIVFNYSSGDLKDLICPVNLPDSFYKFRSLIKNTSGLAIDKFKDSLWVVSKQYTHKIKVLNTENQPVSNAYIESIGAYSNFYGNIFLDLDSTESNLIISHINYQDYKISLRDSDTDNLIVYLKPKEIQLNEINLRPLYTNSIFLNRENQIRVNNKKMPLLAGQTQQDAFVSLLNLPQINTNVESVAELNIKGGINDQNLVLWNGIRMFQNAHFFGLLSAFNENLINSITVIDNSTPAEYGNALTSTISLEFDDNITEKNRYGIGVNTLSSQVFSRIGINDNTELSLAFQRSFTDIFDSPAFQSYTEKAYEDTDLDLLENNQISNTIQRQDDFYYQDAQFQLKKKFGENLKVNVQGIWFENALNYQERSPNEALRNSNYDNENIAIGIDASLKLSNKQNLKIKSNYTKHTSQGRNNTFSGSLDTSQSNSVENYVTQFIWQKNNANSELKLGADFEGSVVFNNFNNVVTEAFLNLGQVSNIYSGFGSYSFTKGNWFFYGGIRSVYFQRDEQFRIEPRLQVAYKLNNNFDFVLRGEVKSQNFKQIIDLDQNFLGIEKRRWVVSGDSISPPLQRTSQVESMLKWKFSKIGGYASVYLRDLKGISTNDQRFQNEGQFQQLLEGDSKVLGAILHVYYKNNWLNTWFSYSYINEELSFGNISFKGNNNLPHQITWGNNINYKDWSLSFAINYHSGLPFTNIEEDNPLTQGEVRNVINYEKANNDILPRYFRIDTSLQYQLKTNNYGLIKFSLGLINLTDEHNTLRRNYRLNRTNQEEIQQIDNVGLGFTPNIGILWNL